MEKIQVNTIDLNFAKGATYVMNGENFLKVLDIVCKFLNSSCNEMGKQEVYQEFVKTFTFLCKYNASDILDACTNILVDKYRVAFLGVEDSKEEKYKDAKKLMSKVLNDPIFIDGIKNPYSYFNHRWKIPNIISLLHEFFRDDTILSILKNNKLPKTYFLVFGSHPVLLRDLDLQKKWISYYAKSNLTLPYLRCFYITDEALKSVSVDVGVGFALNFLSYAHIKEDNIPNFKLETLAKISSMYSVANRNDEKVKRIFYIIKNIQDFSRLALMCK